MKKFPTCSAFIILATAVSGQVVTYDFNSQWNGDWDTYHIQTGGAAAFPSMNYSKASEGRTSGAGGNRLGGTVQALGYQGSMTSIYQSLGSQDLSSTGSQIRLQGSYSAFGNDAAFVSGSSEVGQVGLLSAPSFSNANDSVLKLGDSVYLGFVEQSWTGSDPANNLPGSANVELGLFVDGSMQQSFGTFSLGDYGGRVGTSVWSQWFEYDILFETLASGDLGYKIGVNTVSFFDNDLFTAPEPTEGSSVSLGVWQGSVAAGGGLGDLSDLYVSYGAYIAPDGNASITGYTFDHSPTGNLHDGIIVVPEPSAAVLGLGALLLPFLRRRR